MKQFRFAASLLALAMLGACSSEEPIPGGGDNTDNETGLLVSLSVKGVNLTRETDNNEKGDESSIKTIQIVVSDKDGNVKINKRLTSSSKITLEDESQINAIQGDVVYMAIDNTTFNEMKLHASENWDILVYANGANVGTNNATARTGILTGSTKNATWGVKNADVAKEQANDGFAMSNSKQVKGALKAIGSSDDGKTQTTAWEIAADIELTRLATRFDYVANNSNNYTLQSNSAVKLSIVGMGVNTFATDTYRVAQFSSDGKVPTTGGVGACTHFEKPATGTWYRVTDSYDIADEDVEYPENYAGADYYLIPGTKEFIYARPNTISTGTTLSYTKVPYVVVKAKFDMSDNDENTSAAKHEALFAVNGVFIGGARDLKALKTANKDFKITYDTSGIIDANVKKAIEDQIAETEKNVNAFIKGHAFGDVDVQSERATDNSAIESFLQAERYTYDTDNNGYFTYYAAYIQHSNDSDDCWKYGVSRNHVYQLGVASFGLLGNNGEGQIGEGPKVSNVHDLIMKLNVTVAPWTMIGLNSGLKL